MMRRSRTDDSGAVAMEFAMLVPLALLCVGFLMTLGLRSLWASLAEDAARSLVRYESIRQTNGSYPNRAAVITRSSSLLGGVLGTPTINITQTQSSAITYNQDSTNTSQLGEGDLVTVTATYNVPGASVLASLVKNLPLVGTDLSGWASVSGSATARRE